MLVQNTSPEEGAFAWAADRVFDGRRVWLDHAVVVDNGVVTGVLPRDSVPCALPLLGEPGTTIVPGLIDAHTHFMRWQAPLFLAYGVTTLRDVGNDLAWILAQREQAKGGASPRILCVGPMLDGPVSSHRIVSRSCANLATAVTAVRETAATGVDGIKLYHNLDREWLSSVVKEVHAVPLKASMHCLQTGVLAAAEAGVDEFFHLDGILTDVWPNHPPGWLEVWGLPAFSDTLEAQRRVVDRTAELGMTATPTLAYWESRWRNRTTDDAAASAARPVPPEMVEWQGTASRDAAAASQARRALEAAQRFTGLLLGREVRVLAGTDVPFGAVTPGLSLWRELSLLVQSGMSALQALRSATADAADFLGRPLLGRLMAGAVADMVVVRGDPTERIPTEPDVAAVVHSGVIKRPAEFFAQAREVASTVTEDPWSTQFRIHCAAQ